MWSKCREKRILWFLKCCEVQSIHSSPPALTPSDCHKFSVSGTVRLLIAHTQNVGVPLTLLFSSLRTLKLWVLLTLLPPRRADPDLCSWTIVSPVEAPCLQPHPANALCILCEIMLSKAKLRSCLSPAQNLQGLLIAYKVNSKLFSLTLRPSRIFSLINLFCLIL